MLLIKTPDLIYIPLTLSKIEFIEHPLCPSSQPILLNLSSQVEPAVRQGRPPLRDWPWVDLFLDARAVVILYLSQHQLVDTSHLVYNRLRIN